MLSYEDWETLEKPQLKPIDETFITTLIGRVCIGSFIVKVKIHDQMRYCLFYVANKTRLQEGAIISLSWLSKTKTLFEPESQESPKITKSSKAMEPKKVETPKSSIVASPKPQPATNLLKLPKESTTRSEGKLASSLKVVSFADIVKLSIPQKAQGTGDHEPFLSSPTRSCPVPEPSTPIIPIKPAVQVTYEAKGKGKMDDQLPLSSPKIKPIPTTYPKQESSTSSKSAAKNSSAINAMKPRKSKIFQPKYPSEGTQNRQTRYVFISKEQLRKYNLDKGDEIRWVEQSVSSSH